jgi:hypothetical protein
MSWKKIVKDLPTDIDAGLFRGGTWDAHAEMYMNIQALRTGYAKGPEEREGIKDLAEEGPSGWNFVYQKEANLVPRLIETDEMTRTPGPGEPGFICIEQKNLLPQENPSGDKNKNT